MSEARFARNIAIGTGIGFVPWPVMAFVTGQPGFLVGALVGGIIFLTAWAIWVALDRLERQLTEPVELAKVCRDGVELHPDDPLARAINKAWRTGETVVWNEGDPLP